MHKTLMGTPANTPRTAWKPGQSGNPNGRPKALAQMRELIREHGPRIIERQIKIALGEVTRREWTDAGDPVEVEATFSEQTNAAKLALAYGYGLPTQSLEVTGAEGGPIQMLGVSVDLDRLSGDDFRVMRALAMKAAVEALPVRDDDV